METVLKRRVFWTLILLYFVQGIPHGFISNVLLVDINQTSSKAIDIALWAAFYLSPWTWKLAFAPLIDAYFIPSFGRRKSWILPLLCIQILLCCILGSSSPSFEIQPSISTLFMMPKFNWSLFLLVLATAIQDVAVDGFAAESLRSNELQNGNVIQVVSYKLGMLLIGGLSAFLISSYSPIFWLLALIYLFTFLFILLGITEASPQGLQQEMSLILVFKEIGIWIFQWKVVLVILLCISYKMGEVWLDTLHKPYLKSLGFDGSQIKISSFWSNICSIIGSLLVFHNASTFKLSLGRAYSLRLIPLWLKPIFIYLHPSLLTVTACLLFDSILAGMLSPLMFATMMEAVNQQASGAQYTLLATLEVIPKLWIIPPLAGFVFDTFGTFISLTCGLLVSLLPFAVFSLRTRFNHVKDY